MRERSEKLVDLCTQLFLPAMCPGPATLSKPATPPVSGCVCFLVSSDRH